MRGIVLGLLVVSIFFDLGGTSNEDVHGMTGTLAGISFGYVMMNLMSTVIVF